jgi:cell wall-associated NlpC family hydrolase
MADDTIESMQVELTANIGPLLASIQQGLEVVRAKVQGLKDAGRVDITASIDQLLGSLGEAGTKTKEFKRQADKDSVVSPGIDPKGFLSGLASLREKAESVARGLGSVFFAAAGFREITSLLGEWIHASGEQEVALARLRSSLTATGAAGEQAFEPLKKQAEDLAKQYGQFGAEAIQSGMAVLASFKLQQGQIEALTPVLMDAATGLTKMGEGEVSLEQVAMLVGKAINGHAEALQRLGIQVDAAKFKLDPLGAVVEALNRRFQGLTAAVAQTDEGKLKSMAERWGEIKKVLGELVTTVLIPIVEAIRPVLNAFLSLPQPVQEAVIVIGALTVAMNVMNVSLLYAVNRLLLFIDTTGVAAVRAVVKFVAALGTLNFSALLAGIAASITALRAMIATMSTAGLTLGVFMAGVAAAYAVGKGIAYLLDKVAQLPPHYQEWSEAELQVMAAHLKAKWGIDMTVEAMRLFMQLSPQVRHNLVEEAKANGQTTISLDQLTAARKRELEAQEESANALLWKNETAQLNDFLAYYRQSRASQIATDIAATEKQLQLGNLTAEQRMALEERLTGLLRQAAQERVSQEKEAAQKATEAAKKTHDEQVKLLDDLLKKYADAAKKKAEAWKEASKEISLAALSDRTREEAEIRLKAQEYREDANTALHTAQEKADAMVRIAAWEKEELAKIDDKYRLETEQKEEQEAQKRKAFSMAVLQEQQQLYDQALRSFFDPVNAWLAEVNATLDIEMGKFANAFVQAVQPLQQALAQFLATGNMNWRSVLNGMKQYFAQQFAAYIIKEIGKIVMTWIFGERAKQAASKETAVATAASSNMTLLGSLKAAGAAIIGAVAKIYQAHAHIPFVGVALAAGFVALMMAGFMAVKKALGFASGGLVTGPTYGLVGEAGPEIIAPVADFKEVVAGLVQDTLSAVREAAWAGGSVVSPGTGSADSFSGAAGPGNNIHLHGFALMDLGERATARNIARNLQRINIELGRGIVGGA